MDFQATVDELLDGMAKPPNSLGLLEKHLKKMLLCWGQLYPQIVPYHLVFAADNGVTVEGVTNYPPQITYLMAKQMVEGRATISSFCRCHQIPYSVIDVGIDHDAAVGINRKAARGTRNFTQAKAMSQTEFEAAFEAGKETVSQVARREMCNLLSFGEMGIGNTTTSSAVLYALTGVAPEFVVGYGAGQHNTEIVNKKCAVIAQGVERHRPQLAGVRDIMRCVGGFDIAAICAGMTECANLKLPFVIDGFITAVAYACAVRINPEVEKYAIPSHMSKEPGMVYALLCGGIRETDVPITANMALGEGTGAVLMISLLKTMLYAVYHTARLSEFGVNPPKPLAAGL